MNTPGPIISVVLSSCNQLNSLKFTLLSLRDQSPDEPHEIIVVDCASTDGTDQFLTGQAHEGTIRAILNKENQSRTSARNQGAHAASGQFIMFLDPGVIVGPHWWESLLRTLRMDSRVGAAAGKVILPDGRIDHAGLALLEWWDTPSNQENQAAYGNRLTTRSILAGRPAETPASNQPLRVRALAGEALMVRASAFFAVGGFSARLGRDHHQTKADCAGELSGADLCLRLGSRGWECVYRFESVMTRLRPGMTGQAAAKSEFSGDKEQDIFNATWLGRVRGDFRIVADEGTMPADQTTIRRYIEPVISFSGTGEGGAGRPEERFGRGMSSVVIVTRNELEATRTCTAALRAHTDLEHEVIFVDCGSTDGTTEHLTDLVAGRRNWRLLKTGADVSLAAATNQGLAASAGKHVVLLSNHAVVTPGWLEILASTADLHPHAGLVGPVTNRTHGLQRLGQVDYDQDNLRGLNSFAAQVAENQAGRVDKTMRLSGFCLLIKRELMARIGGMDEQFTHGNYEDNDYCLRGQLAGYESLVAGGCFVHKGHDSEFTEEQITRMEQIRGQWEIFKAKWGIPREKTLGEPMDLSSLLTGGFQPGRHFQPLPMADAVGMLTQRSDQARQEASCSG
jgi:GT2 family glycosyltransferase